MSSCVLPTLKVCQSSSETSCMKPWPEKTFSKQLNVCFLFFLSICENPRCQLVWRNFPATVYKFRLSHGSIECLNHRQITVNFFVFIELQIADYIFVLSLIQHLLGLPLQDSLMWGFWATLVFGINVTDATLLSSRNE